MKKETVEKGQSLLLNIKGYSKDIMALDSDVRKVKDKSPIISFKFFDEEGDMVVRVDDIGLIEMMQKIVSREYSRRVLDMENQFDIL